MSSFPGANPQESEGRLINGYVEPLGELEQKKFKWVRSSGLTQFSATSQSGYRGGLTVNSLSYECWSDNASTVNASGFATSLGSFPGTAKVSIARNQASPIPDVVAVDPSNGAYVLGSATVVAATLTATIAGAVTTGSTVALTFLNYLNAAFPVTISYTVVGGDTTTTIANGVKAAINANSVLSSAYLTATSSAAVVTINQMGSVGNNTSVFSTISSGETVALSPTSGYLTGGHGTEGAFTGSPTSYNAGGVLPEPNSIAFQDGYFFFTTGSGQVYATGLNGLSMNALTYITVEAKADVNLLRAVAFSGLLLCFTTGSCEVWQDAGNPPPGFPYSRIAVLEFGLAQQSAIAGFDTGFSELLWVGQDNAVHWMTSGSLSQIKASPPDLDRLIEAEIRAGNTLEAGCYISGGKKFWAISSPDWTWEINLSTRKWNERQSLLSTGVFGRWRGTGGHPAFGYWLVGDEQSGNLLFVDDANFTEAGAVQLWRLESGPVKKFPVRQRVARADFDFVAGVGQAVGSLMTKVTGAASGNDGVVRLTVASSAQMDTADVVSVVGITGTTEANGNWTIEVIDATHIELQSSVYANAYTSGGTVIDLTVAPNVTNPSVAVSMSKDGGLNWGNPLIRSLGAQGNSRDANVYVLNMGLSGVMGVRWRLDVTDPVYVSFLGAVQSAELRAVGS